MKQIITGKYATVNGLHMYYEIHGSGRPLVLIHGAASTIQTTFGRLLPALEKTHKIIAVELQAHGHSDNRDGRPITFEQDADDYKQAFLSINPSQESLHIMFDQCVQRMQHFTDIPDETIAAIQAPALILSGDKDVPLPEHAVEMYHRMPQASLAIFPDPIFPSHYCL